MAKAEKVVNAVVVKQRQRKVVTYQPETVYERQTLINLLLTEGEADFLIDLLSMVGGDTKDSPAKYGRRIAKALFDATGLEFWNTDAYAHQADEAYDIRFKPYDKPKSGSKK